MNHRTTCERSGVWSAPANRLARWLVLALLGGVVSAAQVAAQVPTYPNIAGTYSGTETATLTITADGQTEIVPISGNNPSVVLSQTGNRFQYTLRDPNSDKSITRHGTLTGNAIVLDTTDQIVLFRDVSGLNVTENKITSSSGTVRQNRIEITTRGRAAGRLDGTRFTIDVESFVVLSGSVTPLSAPTITTQPASRGVAAPTSSTFTITAIGTSPLTYAWQRQSVGTTTWNDLTNAGAYSGVTTATLTVSGTSVAMSGEQFRCLVTNPLGSAVSNAATLTVTAAQPPVFSTQPQPRSAAPAASVTFGTAVSGTPAPTLQWQRKAVGAATWTALTNAGAYSGVTTATLTVASITAAMSGDEFRCVATNAAGTATSNAAALTLILAPAITTQPQSRTVTAGASATFTVTAVGAAPLSYQWRKDGVNISGATVASYSIAGTQAGHAGSYRVVISNAFGLAESTAATLVVNPAARAPTIASQPQHQVVTTGTNVTISVLAYGASSYQWRKNGTAMGGATGSTLSLSGVQFADSASYDVVVGNAYGTVTSSSALVCVGQSAGKYRLTHPAADTANLLAVVQAQYGPSATVADWNEIKTDFGANVAGFFQMIGLPNNSSAMVLVGGVRYWSGNRQYHLGRFDNGAPGGYLAHDRVTLLYLGSWSSFTMPIVAKVPGVAPMLTSGPVSRMVAVGDATTLTVTATGPTGLGYQWRLNGMDIPGATGATYSLASVQAFHAGVYTVVVTSAGSVATSAGATLTASTPPANAARLLNLSTRGFAQSGANVLIPGFVISGTGSKRLLLRAVGPTLAQPPFNLTAVAPDPQMALKRYNSATSSYDDFAANDNWQTNANVAEIITTSAALFAFALQDAKDAALLVDLPPGQYSVLAGDKNGASGIAIVELYDADTGTPGSRLINISNRGYAGVGTQVMIPGFVVSSEGPKTLLVRVVGPTLGAFGVSGTMADPKLTVYSGPTPILTNDNWGDNPDAAHTAQIAQQVSAFSLNAGSKDAAFVVTLPPGVYTVVGSSADGVGTGIVLVEVYVVP